MNSHQQQQSVSSGPAVPQSVQVPFFVRSAAGDSQLSQPVSNGVCLRKGLLHHAGEALVDCDSGVVLAQTEVLSRWSDGSIRWLLVSWISPAARESETCFLRLSGHPQDCPDAGENAARLILRRAGDSFILQRAVADGTAADYTEIEVTPRLVLRNGTGGRLQFGDLETEVAGPVRAVYRAEAVLAGYRHMTVQLRFEVWPEAGLVQVHTRVRNSRRARHRGGLWDLGDAGSFIFRGLLLETRLNTCEATQVRWKAEAGSPVVSQSIDARLRITQFGSGGPNWKSTNHVNAAGQSTVRLRGYEVAGGHGTGSGLRAEPVVAVESRDCRMTVTVPEFWQKFPSSLSVTEGCISVGLFPDRDVPEIELQGGEQSTQSVWISTQSAGDELDALRWTGNRLQMIQPVDWVQKAGVFDWFAGRVVEDRGSGPESTSFRYGRWLRETTRGSGSLVSRRDSIDEYGWRHFGEIPADHEQTHFAGSTTIISHYNNQFDLVYGGILNRMVSGDTWWWDLFDPLARHVMDIDIYHTEEDRAVFNGGLFWHTDHYVDAHTATHRTYSRHNAAGGHYGGGPGNEHNYTTGLLYYYYLTGNPEAAASVRSLADWVISMDDGRQTVFGLLDDGPTGLSTMTVVAGYHGPARGSGNSINALLDGWELTKEDRYLQKAEELIQRVIHPDLDVAGLNLLDAEHRWSYTVCLTAVGRYLAKMDEADRRGPAYDYARRSFCRFGEWMAGQERPTLSQPDQLEYVTEAWAAQDFRKANVLRIAASCCDDLSLANRMRIRADELNDAAWQDLYQFGDKHTTARCLSILMTEGLRDVFHREHREHQLPVADQPCCLEDWDMFVPQKDRVKRLLRSPVALLARLPRLFHPGHWYRTIDALRRRS